MTPLPVVNGEECFTLENRLAQLLIAFRGTETRAAFARRLHLSYTFVREMEMGNRFPSDENLVAIATELGFDPKTLAVLAYCDRSALLAQALEASGVMQGVLEEVERLLERLGLSAPQRNGN